MRKAHCLPEHEVVAKRDSILHSGEGRPGDQVGIGEPQVLPAGKGVYPETDHRALTWIHTMKDHNSRMTRWYLTLQPYQLKVRHRPGPQNKIANYLSRYPVSSRPGEGGGDVTN